MGYVVSIPFPDHGGPGPRIWYTGKYTHTGISVTPLCLPLEIAGDSQSCPADVPGRDIPVLVICGQGLR